MTKQALYEFMASQRLAVLSSTGPDASPQSAVVGIAVTPTLEIVFDTLSQSRKAQNLIARPTCALVIGWDNEMTVQYEGLAEGYRKYEEGTWKDIYFRTWPGCREHLSWPGLMYFVVSPRWLRYSDFNMHPPEIAEFTF